MLNPKQDIETVEINLSEIDAVIFDMNGTMVDDDKLHLEAWKQVCLERFKPITDQEYDIYVSGRRNQQILSNSDFFGKLDQDQIKFISELKEKHYQELCLTRLVEVDGVVEAIKSLASHGKKLGIATNAPLENREIVLKQLKIGSYFPVIVGEEHVKNGKPDPEMFLKVASDLGVSPNRCLVFEDSIPGVQAAKAANMKVVAVLTSRARADLKLADYAISNFKQLILKYL